MHLLENDIDFLEKIFPRILIFGSMNPQGKIAVIKFWMDNYEDVIVGMCGDGGNDCGALRMAHVGVALCDGPRPGKNEVGKNLLLLLFEGS